MGRELGDRRQQRGRRPGGNDEGPLAPDHAATWENCSRQPALERGGADPESRPFCPGGEAPPRRGALSRGDALPRRDATSVLGSARLTAAALRRRRDARVFGGNARGEQQWRFPL